MAKKKASRQKKMQTRVDFTPMVDMMMLLITFFMLCTSLAKPQTMNLTMPSNDENISDKDRNAAKASQTVTIYVCGNDKIYHVDGRKHHGARRVSARCSSTTLPRTVHSLLRTL